MNKTVALASVTLLVGAAAGQNLVTNNLSGNVQFDGWENLGGLAGYGISEVGPFSPAGTAWPSAIGSDVAGSGDSTVNRTFGTHYSASASLYSFAGPSGFTMGDNSAIADLATVVFTIADWAGSSPTTDPVLSFNGGTQQLAATAVASNPFGDILFGGDSINISVRTFQWDLSAFSGITDFSIDWTQGSSAGIVGFQLEQSDVFSVASAIPVPAPGSLALLALGGLTAARRRR